MADAGLAGLTLKQADRLEKIAGALHDLAYSGHETSPADVLGELLRIDDGLILPLLGDVAARADKHAAKAARA